MNSTIEVASPLRQRFLDEMRMIANAGRSDNLARARELLHVAPALPKTDDASDEPVQPTFVCPDCGAAMIVIETMARKQMIRAPPKLRGAP